MSKFDIKDTAAYKVVDQLVSHMYGGAEWDGNDLVCVYRLFCRRKGSWEGVMNGDSKQFRVLEDAIGDYINYRDITKAARNLNAG